MDTGRTNGRFPGGPAPGLGGRARCAVKGVTRAAGGGIVVGFPMRDARGCPVDKKGLYTVNTPIPLRFSLSYISKDSDGNVLPYTVLTQSSSATDKLTFQPTAYSS